jgi:chromosome segregation ATPase
MVIVCLGLGIALITVQKRSTDRATQDGGRIDYFSNQVVTTSEQLDKQKQVTAMWEKDMETEKKILNETSNTLSSTMADLSKTKTDLEVSQKEVAKRDTKINELESENQQLDKQALDLSTAITNLTTQIADTEKKLATSEGDKAFLEKELARLTAEKAELERQFNDLTVLRAQVSKLKEELNIARRLEWIREGLFARSEQKGAQQLMQGAGSLTAQAKPPKPAYDLNVEVSADGSVKVIPPLTGHPEATNSPPAK